MSMLASLMAMRMRVQIAGMERRVSGYRASVSGATYGRTHMHSTGSVAQPDTPIYEEVTIEHGWSPDDLRTPLDVDAMIAASYGSA